MTQHVATRTYRTFDDLRRNEPDLSKWIVRALSDRMDRGTRETHWAGPEDPYTNVTVELTDDGAIVIRNTLRLTFQRFVYAWSTDIGYRFTGYEVIR